MNFGLPITSPVRRQSCKTAHGVICWALHRARHLRGLVNLDSAVTQVLLCLCCRWDVGPHGLVPGRAHHHKQSAPRCTTPLTTKPPQKTPDSLLSQVVSFHLWGGSLGRNSRRAAGARPAGGKREG